MSAAEKPAPLALVSRSESSALGVSGGVRIEGMADVFRVAEWLAKARGFVPDSYYQQPAAIAACILTGMELGIPPMTAMREVHVIKGRPSISATLMLTLAQRAGVKTRWLHTDATKATIGVTLPGQAEQVLTYTSDDAKAAGLWGQGNWSKFPANMLRARCTSNAIRAFCPSVIGGSVYESESGEITDGKPAAEYIEATVTRETPPEQKPAPAAKLSLADAKDGPELAAMLKQGADKMRDSAGAARERFVSAVTKHAARLGVDPDIALEWAGLAQKAETVTDDGEVVPAEAEPQP